MKPFAQVIALICAAFVLGLVANAVAARNRKLMLPGYYPSARNVPKEPLKTTAPPPVLPSLIPHPSSLATTTVEPIKPVLDTAPEKPKPRTATKPEPVPAKIDLATRFPAHPDKAYVEISGDDAARLHAIGALTLDARRTSVYEAGHIAGARAFSVWESDIDDKVNKLYEERSDPREQLKPILIYCSGGDCEDSHMLAQKLWGVAFNNIYVYKDGFPDWQKRRGTVHTGSNP
ncbi:MAG: rhodanese-like domain-containing protein [Thermoanaerobaculia bacterium]